MNEKTLTLRDLLKVVFDDTHVKVYLNNELVINNVAINIFGNYTNEYYDYYVNAIGVYDKTMLVIITTE